VNHSTDAPVSITSARTSRSADIRRREIRYLMSMGIRTLCFVGAFIASGALRWTLVVAALILPYIAVVIANATDRRSSTGSVPFVPANRPMLESRQPDAKPTDETP
jgi:Protein of unknown function (DUF3099)